MKMKWIFLGVRILRVTPQRCDALSHRNRCWGRLTALERPDYGFQYIIVRGYGPEHCIVGLMARKTAIEEEVLLARSTPLFDSLLA